MENKREEKACVFHITGGNNQIMPNVTEVVQNFYVDRSGVAIMKERGVAGVRKKVHTVAGVEFSDRRAESLRLAEGELRIFYAVDVSL